MRTMKLLEGKDSNSMLAIIHDIIMIHCKAYKSDVHQFAAFKRMLKKYEEDVTWFEESGNVMIKGTGVVLINVKFDL